MPRSGRQAGSRLDRLDLDELGELERGCTLCRLADSRTHVVVGAGAQASDLVFVGDAPGWHEDAVGVGLQGVAGDVFAQLLALIGRTRDDVFLTHAVRCRPPANRTPFSDELQACEGYLFREMAIIRPRLVVTLGNVPLRLVTGRQLQLSRVHGEPLTCVLQGRDTVVLPLFHPGAAARIEELRRQLLHDAALIPRLLRAGDERAHPSSTVELGSAAPAASETAEPPRRIDDQQQLTFEIEGD